MKKSNKIACKNCKKACKDFYFEVTIRTSKKNWVDKVCKNCIDKFSNKQAEKHVGPGFEMDICVKTLKTGQSISLFVKNGKKDEKSEIW